MKKSQLPGVQKVPTLRDAVQKISQEMEKIHFAMIERRKKRGLK